MTDSRSWSEDDRPAPFIPVAMRERIQSTLKKRQLEANALLAQSSDPVARFKLLNLIREGDPRLNINDIMAFIDEHAKAQSARDNPIARAEHVRRIRDPNLDLWNRARAYALERGDGAGGQLFEQATPFALDFETTMIAAGLAHSASPAKLAAYASGVILPYEVCWIEANFTPLFFQRDGLMEYQSYRADQQAYLHDFVGGYDFHPRIGFYLERAYSKTAGGETIEPADMLIASVVQIVAASDGQLEFTTLPFTYRFSRNALLEPAKDTHPDAKFRRFNNERTRVLSWGLAEPDQATPNTKAARHLARSIEINWLSPAHPPQREADLEVANHWAIPRFLLACLAVLNEIPTKTVRGFRPAGSFRAGDQMRPFLNTSIVSISLPQKRRIIDEVDRAVRQSLGRKIAEHPVRAHYLTANQFPKVEIARQASGHGRWEAYMDTFSGKTRVRTFIKEHLRGSTQVGHNEHIYVTSAKSGAAQAYGLGKVN